MKGLFIPEITTEMFRNGCLESIESLMAEGEIYDIDYPLGQEPVLAKKAIEVGKTSVFSATEAGKAMEYMGAAGWKSEEMLAGIQGAVDLAAASGEDVATASSVVVDTLTAIERKAEIEGERFGLLQPMYPEKTKGLFKRKKKQEATPKFLEIPKWPENYYIGINWMCFKDPNDLNKAIKNQEWEGLTNANSIISITYNARHDLYVAFWRYLIPKEKGEDKDAAERNDNRET